MYKMGKHDVTINQTKIFPKHGIMINQHKTF